MNGRVYVYLRNEEIARAFLHDADREGFSSSNGFRPSLMHTDTIIAVNPQGTLHDVGFVGKIAFGSGAHDIGNDKLIRVDYERYRIGCSEESFLL